MEFVTLETPDLVQHLIGCRETERLWAQTIEANQIFHT